MNEKEIDDLEQDKKRLLKLLKAKDIYEDNIIIQMYLSLLNEINSLKDKIEYKENKTKKTMSYFDLFPHTMRRVRSGECSKNDDNNIEVEPKNHIKKL